MRVIQVKLEPTGSQVTLLNKMIEDGSIKYIKIAYIEFHGRRFQRNGKVNDAFRKSLPSMGLKIRNYLYSLEGLKFIPS